MASGGRPPYPPLPPTDPLWAFLASPLLPPVALAPGISPTALMPSLAQPANSAKVIVTERAEPKTGFIAGGLLSPGPSARSGISAVRRIRRPLRGTRRGAHRKMD